MRIKSLLLLLAGLAFCLTTWSSPCHAEKPNVIFILADDLGFGDLGCYGQSVIKTPRLDQMAAEGMRFTQFYAGATVCAPSRSVLMTGMHTGHTWVRGNAGRQNMLVQSLRDEDVTLAELMKDSGYSTGLIGKWGLGEVDQPGFPLRQGFDSFFGYLNQRHAHNYYPEFLWRGAEKQLLRNVVERPPGASEDDLGGTATKRVDYSHDLFAAEALEWVTEHKDEPFFLYLAFTTPHANNEATRMVGDGAEVPTYGAYATEDWPNPDKGQAAMITRMDADIGRLLDLLAELELDEETIVFFSSDNGPHNEANHDLGRFNPAGPFRGIKRSLTEGGIRVPLIVRWPGKIESNAVAEHVCYGADILPTICDLVGSKAPEQIDGISFLPTILGDGEQAQHDYLYWEFYEQGSRQSVRFGNWAAIREPMLYGDVQLYDLSSDVGQSMDVAGEHPELVERATRFLDDAHAPHQNWKVPERREPSSS